MDSNSDYKDKYRQYSIDEQFSDYVLRSEHPTNIKAAGIVQEGILYTIQNTKYQIIGVGTNLEQTLNTQPEDAILHIQAILEEKHGHENPMFSISSTLMNGAATKLQKTSIPYVTVQHDNNTYTFTSIPPEQANPAPDIADRLLSTYAKALDR